MEYLNTIITWFAALETHMDTLIFNHGHWTYFILFMIIFSETAFVFTPFLPGDSLLIAAGVLCSNKTLDIKAIIVILSAAAILGNICNYWIGYFISHKAFNQDKSKLFNRENLLKAHQFYEKYGAITIVVSRFIPVVRAFAPFIAGIAKMDFHKFFIYNFLGGSLWICSFVIIGFFFGKISFLQDNSLLVITIMLFVSLLIFPVMLRWFNSLKKKRKVNPQKSTD